jgi:putative SOS response-associated peptidase YedK
MCYSAQVEARFKAYLRLHGATINHAEFEKLYRQRLEDPRLRIPKAIDFNYADTNGSDEIRVHWLIQQYKSNRLRAVSEEMSVQHERLRKAHARVNERYSKTAETELNRASNKHEKLTRQYDDLLRERPKERDSRIFPFWYSPVMVAVGDKIEVRPMRYHMRPFGVPAEFDKKYDGTYNARYDRLAEVPFWKRTFCRQHAVMVVDTFYENVPKHKFERRDLAPGEEESNVVLHFSPTPAEPMYIACLWDRWVGADGSELHSFAAITNDPPPEVAAAGHDRCIVALRERNVMAWLRPDQAGEGAMREILLDREPFYYQHAAVKAA